jgi:hypothetical protein
VSPIKFYFILPTSTYFQSRYYVLTLNGVSGFVPRNYVQRDEALEESVFVNHVDVVREKVKNGQMADREKADLLAKLDLARKNVVGERTAQKAAQQQNHQLQPIPEQNSSLQISSQNQTQQKSPQQKHQPQPQQPQPQQQQPQQPQPQQPQQQPQPQQQQSQPPTQPQRIQVIFYT